MSIPQSIQIWQNDEQIISAYYQLSSDELTKKTIENRQGKMCDTGVSLYKQENSQVVPQKIAISSKTKLPQVGFGGETSISHSQLKTLIFYTKKC